MRYQNHDSTLMSAAFMSANRNIANMLLPAKRNLNNCFAYDLVPSVEVLTAALKAARRVNDFPTAVRVFEGMRHPRQSNIAKLSIEIHH